MQKFDFSAFVSCQNEEWPRQWWTALRYLPLPSADLQLNPFAERRVVWVNAPATAALQSVSAEA